MTNNNLPGFPTFEYADGPPPLSEYTFFEQTEQLALIEQHAKRYRVSRWSALGAVLAQVCASTEPWVQLPAVIGGPASLNTFHVFIGVSGQGKGSTDAVARRAWPAGTAERQLGSGEGIAEYFKVPDNEDENTEKRTRVIFSVPEIGTLAGLAGRQGNIILPVLKSAIMGEPLGQTNASKATSRHVDAHSYRLALSVGAQPALCQVIFNDAKGGLPQRALFWDTADESVTRESIRERVPDPEPLDITQPEWVKNADFVAEMVYGIPEIEETMLDARADALNRKGSELDSHAILLRAKVAALLAIMHQRQTIGQLDWDLAGIVMEHSGRTRDSTLDYARESAKLTDRARVVREFERKAFADDYAIKLTARRVEEIVKRDGELAEGMLGKRLTPAQRPWRDEAIGLLEEQGKVCVRTDTHRNISVRYVAVR